MAKKSEYGEKQITPKARLAFPYLFEPDTRSDGKPKFKATLIFDLSDPDVKAGVKKIKGECLAIAKKAFGEKAKNAKLPFKNGDDKSQYDGFAGNVYISASTTRRPGFCGVDPKQPLNETDIYGGCYVRASVVPATYVMGGEPGVTLYLQNVQKLADGERFGGGNSAPEDDFEAYENNDDIVDDDDTLGI